MNELQQINKAIIEAYDVESLRRMLKFSLNADLDSIVNPTDLTSTVYHITRWAERNGTLEALVNAAREDSDNPIFENLSVPAKRSAINSSKEHGENLVSEHYMTVEILALQVAKIERDLERIRTIVEGPDGGNGVRWKSRENADRLHRIETALKKYDQSILDLSRTIETLEKTFIDGPNLFASSESKAVFGFLITGLLATFSVVLGGVLGYF